MEHHVARDLLGAYVDDELEAPTRAALETHLAGCEDCRALLDGDGPPPVALAHHAEAPAWDERRMRRVVRATLIRTVVGAAAIAALLVLLVGLLADPLLRPIVARGDRLEQAVQAAHDIPLLFTPGASIGDFVKEPVGTTGRITVQVGRSVGARVRPLAEYGVELRAGSMTATSASEPPFLNLDGVSVGQHPPWDPEHVPESTVATVQLEWAEPILVAEAEALVGPGTDAALTWAAFAIQPLRADGLLPGGWDPSVDVGYGTCAGLTEEGLERLARPGRGAWGVDPVPTPGLDNALAQARRATRNLAEADELWQTFGQHDPIMARIDEAAAWLADHEPAVTSVVLTGPSDVLNDTIIDARPDRARLLGIDFYNWPEGGVC